MGLLDDVSTNAKVAGSCNAVQARAGQQADRDMFDSEGFVRGLLRKGKGWRELKC